MAVMPLLETEIQGLEMVKSAAQAMFAPIPSTTSGVSMESQA
jgi:hypothetical protein